jgi:hypothetical protein
MVLADLTNTVKLDTGAVRKIYTLDGHPVNSLIDIRLFLHNIETLCQHFISYYTLNPNLEF